MPDYQLNHGDCLTVMEAMAPGSVDAIVTDPPYGLKFMGKRWDHGLPPIAVWLEALRVLKPGGYLLAFGGTRTYHRLTCSIEDAGFEIRDCLMWLYGSGFPKGKGCLKPAYEPVVWAQKPLNHQGDFDIIIAETTQFIEALLCHVTPAKLAARISRDSGDGDTAPFLASMCTAARQSHARSELTGMFSSPEMASTSLSIASLWNAILAVRYERPSTFTTATETSLTIALRTLNSLISGIIPGPIIRAVNPSGGSVSSAWNARVSSSGINPGSSDIPSPSALASATWPIADAVASGLASIAAQLSAAFPASNGSSARIDATPITGLPTVDLILSRIDEAIRPPAYEPIVLARKPGKKVLPLGIDECKVGTGEDKGVWPITGRSGRRAMNAAEDGSLSRAIETDTDSGRWPPNLLLTHSPLCSDDACHADCVVRVLGEQSGVSKSGGRVACIGEHRPGLRGNDFGRKTPHVRAPDTGTAARYFPQFKYCPKASRRDRNEGCEGMEAQLKSPESTIERVHEPDPHVIAEYLRGNRERAGLSMANIDAGLGTNTMYSWFEGRKAGIQLPTPETWQRLKEIIGFDDTHDAVMTETREIGPEEKMARSPAINPHLVARLHGRDKATANHHPTVKPTALMEWLVRLACPPGGTVLDPFAGSGSTGKACMRAGREFIGIELDEQWLPIQRARIEFELAKTPLI